MDTYISSSLLLFVLILSINPVFLINENQENAILINEKQSDNFANYDILRIFEDTSKKIHKTVELKRKLGILFNFDDISGSNFFTNDTMTVLSHNYSSSENDSSSCHLDLMYTLQNLGNLQNPWAMRLLDSYGKPESGILEGNLKWLGDYSECLNVYAPPHENMSAGNFNGKYCSLQWAIQLPNFTLPITSAVCIPDTCKSSVLKDDVKKFLEIAKSIPGLNNVDQILNITSLTCNPIVKKLNASAIAVLCLMSLFCLLAVLGSSVTAYEYFCRQNILSRNSVCGGDDNEKITQINADRIKFVEGDNSSNDEDVLSSNRKESFPHRALEKCKPFLKCFCVFTNGSKLLNTGGTEGQLLCIHGIRFLSMTWVILGHTYAFCFTAIRAPMEILNYIDNWPFQIVLQGTYSVDSFFLISGFLLTYLFLQEYSKREGKMSWLYFYCHRYIRLTPVYMMALAFSTTVYFYLGSGPLWPNTDVDLNCKNNWWWNLLYINNFLETKDQCMSWSWYLANDMQFFIISPLFLISFWRWPKIGYSLLGICLCGTWLANFFITYEYDLVVGLNYIKSMDIANFQIFTLKYAEYFEKIYIKPYTRIGPYLVGMLLGQFLFRSKRNNKNNWMILCFGWVVASAVTLTCVYGLYHQDLSVLAASFYNAFSRTCFTAGLSWVIYVCLTKQAGIIDSILSYKLFIPLSRLTYCAYLIHPIIVVGYFASMKSHLGISHATMVFYFLGLLIVSYGISLPVSLIFESPIIGLEKLIRNRFQ